MATCEFYAGNEFLCWLTPHKHRLTRIVTLHRIEGVWRISPTRFAKEPQANDFRHGIPIEPDVFWACMEAVSAQYSPIQKTDQSPQPCSSL